MRWALTAGLFLVTVVVRAIHFITLITKVSPVPHSTLTGVASQAGSCVRTSPDLGRVDGATPVPRVGFDDVTLGALRTDRAGVTPFLVVQHLVEPIWASQALVIDSLIFTPDTQSQSVSDCDWVERAAICFVQFNSIDVVRFHQKAFDVTWNSY